MIPFSFFDVKKTTNITTTDKGCPPADTIKLLQDLILFVQYANSTLGN